MTPQQGILYPKDLAALLRIPEKEVLSRVEKGELPQPFRGGGLVGWTRGAIEEWLSGKAEGPHLVPKVSVRPWRGQAGVFEADFRLGPPGHHMVFRRRLLAPRGASRKEALLWAEQQVPRIIQEALDHLDFEEVPRKPARKTPFTEESIRDQTPKDRPYEIVDPTLQGFVLRVLPSGKKVFFVRHHRAGKRERLGLWGPALTLEQARMKALARLRQDPRQEEIVQEDGSLLIRPGTPFHTQVLQWLLRS